MTSRRQYGFALLDVMMTLALVGIVFTMAAVVLDRVWKTERQLIGNDRTLRQGEQMMTLIGRDIQQAKVIRFSPSQITLDGQTTWNIAGDAIERRRTEAGQADRTNRWPLPQADLHFETAPFGLVLAGKESRTSLINTLQWSRQAVNR